MSGVWARYGAAIVRMRFVIVVAWLACSWLALQQPHVDLARGGAGLRSLAPVDLPAIQAELRAASNFPVPLHSRTLAVQHDPAGLPPQAQAQIVERAARGADAQWPDLIGGIPLINRPPLAGSHGTAGTTAVTYLVFRPDMTVTARTRQANAFADEAPGAQRLSAVTGAIPARISTAELLHDALPRLELVTAAAITLVVAAFHRSLVAPLIVLATIAISFVTSRGALGVFANAFDREVPREVEPLLVALLLGVVTDYCLFFMSSMRRLLREGRTTREAAAASSASTGPIVLVAALTVAIGCAALAAARTDFLAAFGPALALTVLIAAAVALTLVPALLAICGAATFWPVRVRRAPTNAKRERAPVMSWLLGSRRRSALVVASVLVPLLAASFQATHMRLGYDAVDGLPEDDPVRVGSALAQTGFAPGIIAPTVLVVEGDGLTALIPELVRFQSEIEKQPGVAGTFGAGTVSAVRDLVPSERPADAVRDPLGLAIAPDGTTARMLVVLDDDPYGGRAVHRLDEMRERFPVLLRRSDLPAQTQVSVAGDTAVVLQLLERLRDDMVRVTAIVIVLDLLLIALFLRSLLAPLLVVAGSVIAVTASLGATTWLFQDVLGSDGITFYVPLATVVLLLSLGADYGVFAIGHAWRLARRLPLREALVRGSAQTSGVIAIAGLILGASFALLAVVPLDAFLQFAVAMSLGILIDTFVVRPVLLPCAINGLGSAAIWPRSGAGARAARSASP